MSDSKKKYGKRGQSVTGRRTLNARAQVEDLKPENSNIGAQVEENLEQQAPNVEAKVEDLEMNAPNVEPQVENPEQEASHLGAQMEDDLEMEAPYLRLLVEDLQIVENADIRYGNYPPEMVTPEVQAHLKETPLLLVRNFRRCRIAAIRRQEDKERILEARKRGEVINVDRLAAIMMRTTLLDKKHFYRNFTLRRARISHERISRQMTARFNLWARRWELKNIDMTARIEWRIRLLLDDATYKVTTKLVEASNKAPYFSYKKYLLRPYIPPEVEDLSSCPSTSSKVLQSRWLSKSRKGDAVKNRRSPACYESNVLSPAATSKMGSTASKSSKGKSSKGSPVKSKSSRPLREGASSSRRGSQSRQNPDQDEKTDDSNKSKDRSPPNGSPTKKMKL